ncbi:hypothetical protein PPERSA_04870 [Pseudocohnilembus persalinus]|uniref:Uncharacterized protein n=1 Tax=Pseudocohnilembus persalinus TaxID=266149 RepID=A0A0V0QJF2_PSEPJ|nr:hypothetical protein PPERSA_04870 [Pseudocohnilembus persalinus]|eukprot:KRX02248.1 hypothetical protein PPERSA_04870 [Pseudocohnilembus persalinus]
MISKQIQILNIFQDSLMLTNCKNKGIHITDARLIESWTNALTRDYAQQIGNLEITLNQFEKKPDLFNVVEFLQKLAIYQVKPLKIVIHLEPRYTNGNGLENERFTGNSVFTLMNAIRTLNKQKLQKISLNFGRIGVNQFSSQQIIKSIHVQSITETLRLFPYLKYISLNLRSWGYQNIYIGDNEIIDICEMVKSKRQTLKQFHLNLFMWGYKNKNLTSKAVFSLSNTIKELQKLVVLTLNLRRFEHTSWNDIVYMGMCISGLKNILKIDINTELWKYSTDKDNTFAQQQVHDFMAYIIGRRNFFNDEKLKIQYKMAIYDREDQPDTDGLLNLKPYKIARTQKQNELMFANQIQKQYGKVYRKELVQEILEYCFVPQNINPINEFRQNMTKYYANIEKSQHFLKSNEEIKQEQQLQQQQQQEEKQNNQQDIQGQNSNDNINQIENDIQNFELVDQGYLIQLDDDQQYQQFDQNQNEDKQSNLSLQDLGQIDENQMLINF